VHHSLIAVYSFVAYGIVPLLRSKPRVAPVATQSQPVSAAAKAHNPVNAIVVAGLSKPIFPVRAKGADFVAP
jgi:hypothetical protein